jgi:hypothetical protein
MSKSLGLGMFFGLCFTAFVVGQAFAGDMDNKKRNVSPTDGLAKAFKAADRLAAVDKGSTKNSGIAAASRKGKVSSKFSTKKTSGKKYTSKGKSSSKTSLKKSKHVRKHSAVKTRSHKKHSAQRTKTARHIY